MNKKILTLYDVLNHPGNVFTALITPVIRSNPKSNLYIFFLLDLKSNKIIHCMVCKDKIKVVDMDKLLYPLSGYDLKGAVILTPKTNPFSTESFKKVVNILEISNQLYARDEVLILVSILKDSVRFLRRLDYTDSLEDLVKN